MKSSSTTKSLNKNSIETKKEKQNKIIDISQKLNSSIVGNKSNENQNNNFKSNVQKSKKNVVTKEVSNVEDIKNSKQSEKQQKKSDIKNSQKDKVKQNQKNLQQGNKNQVRKSININKSSKALKSQKINISLALDTSVKQKENKDNTFSNQNQSQQSITNSKQQNSSKNNSSRNKSQKQVIQTQKAELQRLKAQAIKQLKSLDKQQKLIITNIQKNKSFKKLPDIRQSQSSNKKDKDKNNNYLDNQLPQKGSTVSFNHNDNQKQNLKQSLVFSRPQIKNYSLIDGNKVYMSQQDVLKLKKLKQQNKKREKDIKKKIIQHELLLQKAKTQEVILKQTKILQEKQKRKKYIEQRQKILSKQRENKLQRFQQQNKKLKQIKNSLKLYQKMQNQFKKQQDQQKNNLNVLIKSRMGQGFVNFDQIRQHQHEYLQKNRQNIEHSKQKIKQKIKQLQQQFNELKLHKSQFYQKVKNQKKQLIKQLQENDRKKKIYSQKIKQYKEIVRENYQPNVKHIEKVEEVKKKAHGLSELHNLGNQYMKQGKKLIDRNKSLVILQKLKNQQKQNIQKKKYINYLQRNKTDSSLQKVDKSNPKSKSRSKPNFQMQKQLDNINKIKNPQQKYQKIRILHTKIQKQLGSTNNNNSPKNKRLVLKNRINTDKNYDQQNVNQIKAKLKILQGLQNNKENNNNLNTIKR